MVEDEAGNLDGTATIGGMGYGLVFKVSQTGEETVLHNFTGAVGGSTPMSSLLRNQSGNFYGTTGYGGMGCGTVFELSASGQETLLYSFPCANFAPNGSDPEAGLVTDGAGNLYGTTAAGGQGGVVYEISPGGSFQVLLNFTGGAGFEPEMAGVVPDEEGNLYGTTSSGGDVTGCAPINPFPMSCGLVYELGVTGQETVLHIFTGTPDGATPWSGVIRDAAGNLYGTTIGGGADSGGSIFKVDASGQETVMYSFTGGIDGANPFAGVIMDPAGNLYGTTNGGGAGFGVVYKFDTAGVFTVLYSFTGGADGATVYTGLLRDKAGNLYGTTNSGGAGCGVVYMLDTTGHYNVLHTFSGGLDGCSPDAAVIGDGAGNLYGTTEGGGEKNGGVVFMLEHAVVAP